MPLYQGGEREKPTSRDVVFLDYCSLFCSRVRLDLKITKKWNVTKQIWLTT